MTQATRKQWFVVKVEGGYMAEARNLDTGASAQVGPWGSPLPNQEAVREYIRKEWSGGPENMPGSIFPAWEIGEPSEIITSRCLFDLC